MPGFYNTEDMPIEEHTDVDWFDVERYVDNVDLEDMLTQEDYLEV